METYSNIENSDSKEKLIRDSAIDVIDSAIDGLKSLKLIINDNFIDIINQISAITGRVVVSGMGKSGHIGKKIAATMSSTGTKSFFIHPGEASHGDLGMIDSNDILLLLSNSGETKELKDIIFYAKRFSIKIIAIVSKPQSSLAKTSDYCFVLPIFREALDFDAPTTSSTLMLALGDAISMALVTKKGFTLEDFAIFHPGGRIGASFVKVSDVMTKPENLPLVDKKLSFIQALEINSNCKLGVSIVHEDNKLLGIITDGDIRRAVLKGNPHEMTLEQIMTKNPRSIEPQKLVIEALEKMIKSKITSLIVTENNSILGLIHMHDCLRAGASPML